MRITPQLISILVIIFTVAIMIIVIGLHGKSAKQTMSVVDYESCVLAGGTTSSDQTGLCIYDGQPYYAEAGTIIND